MRVLLLHPDDSARQGPWSRQKWDLVVDLGKSSAFSEEAWSAHYGCRVLRTDAFRHGVADTKKVRRTFSALQGLLLDAEGIDWWHLTSLLVVPEALSFLALKCVAAEIGSAKDLWCTRRGQLSHILEVLLSRSIRSFADTGLSRLAAWAAHYVGVVQRLSTAQFKEIVLDKYDSHYRWRSRFADQLKPLVDSVVLVPSAYGNVSRMAAQYARLLPEVSFLMVATRQSARQFACPPNMELRDLGSYTTGSEPADEIADLRTRWNRLVTRLQDLPELLELANAGIFDTIPGWIRDGVHVRDLWRKVLDQEPVAGVLCGDDSNLYTRLPVLLAARRKIPTVDFHHGALDGRYLLKDLPSDIYLAKNEMERDYLTTLCGLPAEKVAIGAPPGQHLPDAPRASSTGQSIVFFSEPYEAGGMRAEEVFREVLPALCRLARANGRSIVVKLHPFESKAQRSRMVREILPQEDQQIVSVVDGPLTPELLSRAWFGITVESTTVIDCLQNGICCFLCGWLTLGPFEYVRQYARFGVGEVLETANEIPGIPKLLAAFSPEGAVKVDLFSTADPAMLKQWLTGPPATVSARSVS